MKRNPTVVATVFFAVIAVQTEGVGPECEAAACAREQPAIVPGQPHGLERLPAHEVVDDEIRLLERSPLFTFKVGSPYHIDWLREHGLRIEDWERAQKEKAASS